MTPASTRALALALALGPAVAFAQAPAPSPEPPHITETVEVVAKGLEEPTAEVPAMITVVGGDEMADRNVRDLRNTLSVVSGVDVAPGGDQGPASSVPEFWGLKEFDAFLLLVDEVPSGGAFNPALSSLSLEDVERVEVLRGPAPVMYGATSFVGVLHVVHRSAADREGEIQLFGGSHGTGGGVLALPVPKWAGFDSRFVADFTSRGFEDDRTGYRRGHARFRNSRNLGSGHFGFDLDLDVLDQDPASPHPREGRTLSTAVPLDANHNPDGAFLNDRRFTGTVRYDVPVGGASWNSIVSYSHWTNDIFRGFLVDVSDGPDNARGIQGKVDGNDLYVDTHFSWPGHQSWKAVAGVDHLHGEGKAQGADFDYTIDLAGLHPPAGLEASTVPDDDQVEDRREFTGLYGFVEWDPASSLRLEGGLRLNHTSEEREDPREQAQPKPAGFEDPGKRDDTRVTGTAAISWTPWEKGGEESLRFFADYRHAFKPAAFDFGIGEGESEAEEGLLEPESADVYEAGIRTHLAGGKLELEATGFRMDFENLVVATAENGLPALENAGSERFQGVEVEAEMELRESLTARAAYAYHDAKFRDYEQAFDGVPTQLGGKRLEMSAHNSGGVQVLWAPPHGLLLAGDLHYVGSRFLNKRNTAPTDGYAEVSASAGWRFKKWEIRVDGRNLTDERPPVAESELGDAQYYILFARQVEASVRLHF